MAEPLVTGLGGPATVAALGLGAVFVASAVAKFRRPHETAATFRGLGLPLPRLLARLVPAIEATVAPALVLRPRPAAAITLVLLAAFTAVLLPQLGRPEPIACGCFGTTAHHPISIVEPARNALLAVAAAVVLTGAGGPEWMAPRLPDLVTATSVTLIGALALQLLTLRRDAGRILTATPQAPTTEALAS